MNPKCVSNLHGLVHESVDRTLLPADVNIHSQSFGRVQVVVSTREERHDLVELTHQVYRMQQVS